MNEEKLNRANELMSEIKVVKKLISDFERSIRIDYEPNDSYSYMLHTQEQADFYADFKKHINGILADYKIGEVQKYTTTLSNRLGELEKEFEQL